MGSSIFFFGAGASVPIGIPTMAAMVEQFEGRLKSDFSPHVQLFQNIKYKLNEYSQFDIEALMRVLYDMIAVDPLSSLNDPSVHYFSDWSTSFGQMSKYKREQAERERSEAEALLSNVKLFLSDACTLKEREFKPLEALLSKVLLKDGYDLLVATSQDQPNGTNCQIFTTNYDLGIEAFLDQQHLPYRCGEGQNRSLNIRSSNSDFYRSDAAFFQVYKLHGSINWYVGDDGRLRWSTGAAESGSKTIMGDRIVSELMLYPASQKYTFLEPFYDMYHHFKQCLLRSEICYVVGYSFRDADILGLFSDVLHLNDNLTICLIDPDAENIVATKFEGLEHRIYGISEKFSIQAVSSIR